MDLRAAALAVVHTRLDVQAARQWDLYAGAHPGLIGRTVSVSDRTRRAVYTIELPDAGETISHMLTPCCDPLATYNPIPVAHPLTAHVCWCLQWLACSPAALGAHRASSAPGSCSTASAVGRRCCCAAWTTSRPCRRLSRHGRPACGAGIPCSLALMATGAGSTHTGPAQHAFLPRWYGGSGRLQLTESSRCSMDRLANGGWYCLENVGPCCPTCNIMRGRRTITQMVAHRRHATKDDTYEPHLFG